MGRPSHHRAHARPHRRHIYDRAAALEDHPEQPRRACIGSDSRTEAEAVVIGGLAHVGAIVASGGTIAAAPIGAAAVGGAGGPRP